MARPDQEAIDTFMSITGVSEATAIRRLEAHAGNLNEAVIAHFIEGDRNITQDTTLAVPLDDVMDVDSPPAEEFRRPSSLFPFSGDLNPFPFLQPDFPGSIFDRSSGISNRSPVVSHPREIREIPIEFKEDGSSGRTGNTPLIEEVTGIGHLGQEIRGTVAIDDEDDEKISNIPYMDASEIRRRGSSSRFRPNPAVVDVPDDKDIEEAMIQAAIEASKWDATMSKQQSDTNLEETPHPNQSHPEDVDFAHAVSLSLQTAQKEKDAQTKVEASEKKGEKFAGAENLRSVTASKGRHSELEVGRSSIRDEIEDAEDSPLFRNRRRHVSIGPVKAEKAIEQVDIGPTSSPSQPSNVLHSQGDGNNFLTDEWGGISFEEGDEAVMLESAMFGGIPEGTGYHFPYVPHQLMRNGVDSSEMSFLGSVPRLPSPSLTTQRMIREQQDDEYLASLQADREKELKAKEDAEAALAEKRLEEDEVRRQLQEEEELERQLVAREVSLPQEPVLDDENAVTLLVRMPDGSRRGRRFFKSDRLQHLFDFIDIGRGIKPNSYRLVMSYPSRAFTNAEGNSTLDELGLSSKQEVLYLEMT